MQVDNYSSRESVLLHWDKSIAIYTTFLHNENDVARHGGNCDNCGGQMNGKNQTMTDSVSLQLGGITAVYLFWFVTWLVLS